MKCNICKKREAVFHIQEQSPTGRLKKLSLCLECAAVKGLNIQKEDVEQLFSTFVQNIFDNNESNVLNMDVLKMLNVHCKDCGTTTKHIADTHEIGCPDCITNFKTFIRYLLMQHNHSLEYKGTLPKRIALRHNYKVEIISLKRELKQSITAEDYHKAAEIRDKINELKATYHKDEGSDE